MKLRLSKTNDISNCSARTCGNMWPLYTPPTALWIPAQMLHFRAGRRPWSWNPTCSVAPPPPPAAAAKEKTPLRVMRVAFQRLEFVCGDDYVTSHRCAEIDSGATHMRKTMTIHTSHRCAETDSGATHMRKTMTIHTPGYSTVLQKVHSRGLNRTEKAEVTKQGLETALRKPSGGGSHDLNRRLQISRSLPQNTCG
jgi:hypothetical protein